MLHRDASAAVRLDAAERAYLECGWCRGSSGVEHATENRGVGSSNLPPGTSFQIRNRLPEWEWPIVCAGLTPKPPDLSRRQRPSYHALLLLVRGTVEKVTPVEDTMLIQIG